MTSRPLSDLAALVAVFVAVAPACGGPAAQSKPFETPANRPEEPGKPVEEAPFGAEAPDSVGITAVSEYEYVPATRLPPVVGAARYKKLDSERTVRFAINVRAGWAPIIYANNGLKPGKVWTTPGGEDFTVRLILMDDPIAMRDMVAGGLGHIGWATVDMLPWLADGLSRESLSSPRVFQQIDWSNGGDGIVVRDSIKSITDLRGKKVVLAQNSPSHYFLLDSLINAGVQPSEVEFVFTQDVFQAAAAFSMKKSLAAAVSWAPDIAHLAQVKGNRLLVSTSTANKLLAGVWFARADFAKDEPEIIEGLVRGIFDSMIELEDDEAVNKAATLMAAAFSIPVAESKRMLGDAHWTNYAENRDFFVNANNPTNFQQTYNNAFYFYEKTGRLRKKMTFDQLVDFSVIKKLGTVAAYKNQKDEYTVNFTPASVSSIEVDHTEILTKTVIIHFYPNSWDLQKKVTTIVNGADKEVLYDPDVDVVLDAIGRLATQYGAARIVIDGHGDASMKGRVPSNWVEELSAKRAKAVTEALLGKFKFLQPNQFATTGRGWQLPADSHQPRNKAKNRRVEIKVYPGRLD